jgi:predicted RNA-binding protein YlqC (UPF0109 family)
MIIKRLVDNPDAVHVNEVDGEMSKIIEVTVDPDDVGKVIGRQGRTADAIRTIVYAIAGKEKKRTVLQILD